MRPITAPLARLVLLLIAALQVSEYARAENDVVLVAHPSVALTRISSTQLKRILSGRDNKWPSGRPVVLVLPPERSAELSWIATQLVGMPVPVYRRFLLGQVFKGELRAPLETTSLSEVQSEVAAHAGAVSALPRSAVPPELNIVEVQ
jgi:hypothetical protein